MATRSTLLFALALTGCPGGGSDDDGGSSTGDEMDPLEIIGIYDDDVSIVHEIRDDRWVLDGEPDTLTFFISYYDNELRFVVAQSPNDSKYHKFEWVYVGDQLYYCQSATLQETAVAAENAPGADSSDPTAGGCVGGPWHPLTPREEG